MKEFYRLIHSCDAIKANDTTARDRSIRLYSYSNGEMWNLQIRSPLKKVDHRDGKDFIVSTASLTKPDLLALKAAVEEALRDA